MKRTERLAELIKWQEQSERLLARSIALSPHYIHFESKSKR